MRLNDRLRIHALILLAAVMGLAYTLYLFPIHFFAGLAPWWNDGAPQDVQVVVLGMRYFVADNWHFPILRTLKINPPEGTIIIYTDCVPILAVVAKLLRQALGVTWNYLGIWVGAVYLLQAISMVVLLVSLGVRSVVPCMTAAVMALSTPAFLFHLFHTGEIAHFLVIFTLALYFFSARPVSFHRIWPWFGALLWLSLWIEAYIFLMVWAVFLAAAIQRAVAGGRDAWKQSTIGVVACLGGSLCLMWVSGLFAGIDSPEGGGFGHYSMNVLSPWVPQWSGLFPGVSKIFGATKSPWGELLIDATGGQYEGYSYLGAGVLLLLCAAVWLERGGLFLWLKRYWCLVLMLFGFTVLALTNHVYVGKWRLDVLPDVPSVFDQVRSSGRFFWPVMYMLLAAAVAIVGLRARGRSAPALLLVAMILQVADATPVRAWVARMSRDGSGYEFTAASQWRKMISIHDRLTILPSFGCRGDLRGNAFLGILDLGFTASESLTTINTTYVGRYRSPDCLEEARRLSVLQPAEGELLVLLEPYSEAIRTSPTHALLRSFCRAVDQDVVCSRRWNQLDTLGLHDAFAPLNDQTHSYQLGTVIDFSNGGNSRQYSAFGWLPQTWGSWSYGNIAGLSLQVEQATPSNLTLVADAGAFVRPQQPVLLVDVEINGQIVKSWTFTNGEPDLEREVTIPAEIVAQRAPIHISFYIHDTKPRLDFRYYASPSAKQPEVGSARLLGLGMRRMHIVSEAVLDR